MAVVVVVQMAGESNEEEVRSDEYRDVGVFTVEFDKDRNKSANISRGDMKAPTFCVCACVLTKGESCDVVMDK